MLRFKAIQLYNWGYSRYQEPLPIGDITLVRGRNGSGKTTYLSAISLLLGVRHLPRKHSYDKFIYPGQKIAFVRAVADNQPDANGRRPFDKVLSTFEDSVTLACLLEYKNRWERTYYIVPGDTFHPDPDQRIEKTFQFNQDNYRQALSHVGVREPLLNLLEMGLNGMPDALRDPVRRFRFFFQLVGDEGVQASYNAARANWWTQREQTTALETKHRQERAKLEEWEQQIRIARRRRELQVQVERSRLFFKHAQVRDLAKEVRTLEGSRDTQLNEQKRLEEQRLTLERDAASFQEGFQQWEAEYQSWQHARNSLENERETGRDAFRQIESQTGDQRKTVNQLQLLPEISLEEAEARLEQAKTQQLKVSGTFAKVQDELSRLKQDLKRLDEKHILYPPDVESFLQELQRQGIPFLLVADAVEVPDRKWQAAVEGALGGERFTVVIDQETDQIRAKKIGERMRYRFFVSPPNAQITGKEVDDSLWQVVKVSDPRVQAWVYSHLSNVRRVETVEDGHRYAALGVMSITPEAYKQERRGGRSVYPQSLVCGRNAREAQIYLLQKALEKARNAEKDAQYVYQKATEELEEARSALRLVQQRLNLPQECARLAQLEEELARLQGIFNQLDEEYQQAKNKETGWNDQRSSYAGKEARLNDLLTRLNQDRKHNHEAVEEIIKSLRRTELQLSTSSLDLQPLDEENQKVFDGETISPELYQRRMIQAEEENNQLPAARYEINEELFQRQQTDVQRLEQEVFQMREREQANRDLFTHALEDFRKHVYDLFGQGMNKHFRSICRMAEAKGEIRIQDDDQDNWLMDVQIGFHDKPATRLEEAHLSQGQEVMSGLFLVLAALKTVNATPILLLDELMSTLDEVNAPLVLNNLRAAQAQCFVATPHVRPQADAIADVIWGLQPKMEGQEYADPVGVLVRKKL